MAEAFDLRPDAIAELARNSFRAAFLPDAVKARYLDDVDRALPGLTPQAQANRRATASAWAR